jgi:hypothetical protein
VRVFKWVVSFATWKYGVEAAHLYASEDPTESGDSAAAAGGLVKVSSALVSCAVVIIDKKLTIIL